MSVSSTSNELTLLQQLIVQAADDYLGECKLVPKESRLSTDQRLSLKAQLECMIASLMTKAHHSLSWELPLATLTPEEPEDTALVARVAELEAQLAQRRAAVAELRASVPVSVADDIAAALSAAAAPTSSPAPAAPALTEGVGALPTAKQLTQAAGKQAAAEAKLRELQTSAEEVTGAIERLVGVLAAHSQQQKPAGGMF